LDITLHGVHACMWMYIMLLNVLLLGVVGFNCGIAVEILVSIVALLLKLRLLATFCSNPLSSGQTSECEFSPRSVWLRVAS